MICERLIEWLDKYIIMDDVTLTDETARYATLALEGPKAAAIAQELSGVDLTKFDDLSSHDAAVGAISGRRIPCRLVKLSPGGVPGAEFVAESERLPELWQLLSEAAGKQGGGAQGDTPLGGTPPAPRGARVGREVAGKKSPPQHGPAESHTQR